MSRPKILYASSSVGLGHVTRDLHLSKYIDWGEVTWLSAGQALMYLESRKLDVLDVSHRLMDLGKALNHVFSKGSVKASYRDLKRVYDVIKTNAGIVEDEVDLEEFDLLIVDEFWELLMHRQLNIPSVFITDFISFKTIGRSIIQRILLPFVNRWIHRRMMRFSLRIYVGFDWRDYRDFEYYGQIFTHEDDADAFDGGYVLLNIGGTDVGRPILDIICPVLERHGLEYKVIGGINMFTPNPVKDIAGARLVITLGGYGSLLELARYSKRGVIIPLGNHFEQMDNARLFMGRNGYRVIPLEKLDEEALYKAINQVLSEEPDPPVFKDASQEISMRIRRLLN